MDIRDLLVAAPNNMRRSYNHGVESLLSRLGLEHRRTTMDVVLPAVAIFGVGLTVGAALGLVFAPKPGEELRTDLGHRIGDLKDRSVQRYEGLVHRAKDLVEDEMPDTRTVA